MNAPTYSSSPCKVLVITDNQSQLRDIVSGLRLEGLDARGETDPFFALERLSTQEHDIVLVDLMIPRMNGLQISRAIRDRHPGLKTVLMSDYLLSPVQLAKADIGVVGFVPKPCKIGQLAEFIKLKASKSETIRKEEVKSTSSIYTSEVDIPFGILDLHLAV